MFLYNFTVRDNVTNTIIESQTLDTLLFEQQLMQAQDLQTLWMIVAMVFLALAVLSLVFNSILACLFCKRVKSKKNPVAEISSSYENNGNQPKKGTHMH